MQHKKEYHKFLLFLGVALVLLMYLVLSIVQLYRQCLQWLFVRCLLADNSGSVRWLQLSFSIRKALKRSHFALSAPSFVRLFSFLRALPLYGFRRITSLAYQAYPTSRLRSLCGVALVRGRNSFAITLSLCPPPLLRAQVVWRVCLAITLWRANLLSGTQAVCVCLRRPPRSAYVDYHLVCPTVFR